MVGKLASKVILITGASSGIGVETARALHATGAHLFLTTRDMQKGQKVVDAILAEEVPSGGKVELLQLELDNLQSVRYASYFLCTAGCIMAGGMTYGSSIAFEWTIGCKPSILVRLTIFMQA